MSGNNFTYKINKDIDFKTEIYITTLKILEKRLDNYELKMKIYEEQTKDLQNKIQWHYIVGILFMIYVLYKL
jgi:uncharacterized protein (DUF342 family)